MDNSITTVHTGQTQPQAAGPRSISLQEYREAQASFNHKLNHIISILESGKSSRQ